MLFAVAGAASAISLISCQQQHSGADSSGGGSSDIISELMIGDCIGHVTYQGDLVALTGARIVDCSSPNAELQLQDTSDSQAMTCGPYVYRTVIENNKGATVYCLTPQIDRALQPPTGAG